MQRLRDGEWIAGAGGSVLLVSLFLRWYSASLADLLDGAGVAAPGLSVTATAWQAFSVLDVVLAVLALVPLALVWFHATRRSPSVPVAFSVLTVVAGGLATLLILYRIINQPGPNDLVDVELGAYLGLLSAVAITAGGWRSLRVEAIPGAQPPPIQDLPAP
jgi:RsiW-degrading membrane proteinase PrsW (M82 family)